MTSAELAAAEPGREALAELPAAIRAEYPFRSRFLPTPAGRLHFVDEGPRDAPVLLCVHGNPTWSFLFRRIVRAVSARRRVVAIDHLGCGLSDKPERWSYRLADHVANLRALVCELELERITLLVHDWGGAIGFGLARLEPRRVEGFVVTNTAAFRSRWMPLRIRACRIPALGPFLVTRCNAFAGLAPRMALAHPERLTPAARAGLLLPYDSPAHRIAIRRFVEDIPMSPSHPSWSTLAAIEESLASFADHPLSIVWGEQDWCFTPRFQGEWIRRFPRARVTSLAGAGHYLYEDEPERVLAAVEEHLGDAARERAGGGAAPDEAPGLRHA